MVKKPEDDSTAPPPSDRDEWEELTQNSRLRATSEVRMRAVENEVSRIRDRHEKFGRSMVRIEEQMESLASRVSDLPGRIEEVVTLRIKNEAQGMKLWVYGGLIAAGAAIVTILAKVLFH